MELGKYMKKIHKQKCRLKQWAVISPFSTGTDSVC